MTIKRRDKCLEASINMQYSMKTKNFHTFSKLYCSKLASAAKFKAKVSREIHWLATSKKILLCLWPVNNCALKRCYC